ncbi:MAG: methylated-DNA--[protein]-cysteine S-methyltransferase [Candidatus Omnitrophica bacterium]|nr:methylated-DNA--[protein]-cysteine S-methyltransferase [Candidatus Omnitrophota bacterium]
MLKVLRNVPATRTVTYSGLARRAQVPHAARAVGNSLSRNPIPILIPCHRVIRKNGSLGGYRGGRRLKRTLLSLERRAN